MPKANKQLALAVDRLASLIKEVRGEKVMLDSDLAHVYGVQTKGLNRAVKRNRDRFPQDFVFQLTQAESESLRRQIGTLKSGRGQHRKYLPYVFTEHGAIMAANVLNSPQAAQMTVFVVRAFIAMRRVLSDSSQLARKLALEKELKERLDVHEAAIVTSSAGDGHHRSSARTAAGTEQIGFHVKERPCVTERARNEWPITDARSRCG